MLIIFGRYIFVRDFHMSDNESSHQFLIIWKLFLSKVNSNVFILVYILYITVTILLQISIRDCMFYKEKFDGLI